MGDATALCVSTSTAVSRAMPLFLGQQHAFGERQHLDGQTKVHRNLHGKRQAVVANVGDFGTNVEQ